jgi:hypothetical protein
MSKTIQPPSDAAFLRGQRLYTRHSSRCDRGRQTKDDFDHIVALMRPAATRGDADLAVVVFWALALEHRQEHSGSESDVAEAIDGLRLAIDHPDAFRWIRRAFRLYLAKLYWARALRQRGRPATRPAGTAGLTVSADAHEALRQLCLVLDDLCQPAEADYDTPYDDYESERTRTLDDLVELICNPDALPVTWEALEPVIDRCRALLGLLVAVNPVRPLLNLRLGVLLGGMWQRQVLPMFEDTSRRFMLSGHLSEEISAGVGAVPGVRRHLNVAIDLLQTSVGLYPHDDERHRAGQTVLGSLMLFRNSMADPGDLVDNQSARHSLGLALESPDLGIGADHFRPIVTSGLFLAQLRSTMTARSPSDSGLNPDRWSDDAATLPSESEDLVQLEQIADIALSEGGDQTLIFGFISCVLTLARAVDDLADAELRALRDRAGELAARAENDDPEELVLREHMVIFFGTLCLLVAERELGGHAFAGPAVSAGLATISRGAMLLPPGSPSRDYLLAQLVVAGPGTARTIMWAMFGAPPP